MVVSASNTADLFSQLFSTFSTLALLVGVVVFALMAYLIIRYRARGVEPDPDDAPRLGRVSEARGHARTAMISVGLSSIIVGVLIFGTFVVNNQINTIPSQCTPPPGQCLYIQVNAYRFGWNFTYPNGAFLNQNLTIPSGRMVVLVITSKDVFHSFGIDDFRVKKDAIPGLTNRMWFIANSEVSHLARCFELCGAGHAFMTAKVTVVSPGHFQSFCSSAGC